MKEIFIFFAGFTLGASVALLLAPESGADLRANIKSKVDDDLPKLKSDFQASMKKTDQRLDKVEADLKKLKHSPDDKQEKYKMTTEEVTLVLVNAGYLSEADVDAAVVVLQDALVIDAAEDAQAEAAEDYSTQQDLVAEAEVWASEDAAEGDIESALVDDEIIEEAQDQMEVDKEVMVEAEVVIEAAYSDAAAALLAAELIDEAELEAVAVAIANAIDEEEE